MEPEPLRFGAALRGVQPIEARDFRAGIGNADQVRQRRDLAGIRLVAKGDDVHRGDLAGQDPFQQLP